MHAAKSNPDASRAINPEISDLLAGGTLRVPSPLGAEDASACLVRAGRRGRLPGFDAPAAGRFRLDCDAVPFEHEIRGELGAESPSGSKITLVLRRKPLMPAIFAVTLALTIWPGAWLTDSLMATYWPAYGRWAQDMPWLTYAWYLPLTVLPLPWMWKSLTRKSRAGAAESTAKILATLREIVAGPDD